MLLASFVVVGLGNQAPAGAASGSPITIGVICSCTGPLGPGIKPEPTGIQAYASYINAHGGIAGHPVSVIVKDDTSTPTTAISQVQQLITQSHITVLVDDSQVDTDFASYVDSQHIPVIGGSSDSDLFLTDPNWFTPGATVDSYFIAYMKAAKKIGAKTVGQMYCAESPVCQQGVPSFKANAQALGLKVGMTDEISYSAPNYDAECVAAKQAGVGLLNVADASFVAERVAANCTQQGYNPYYVAGGAAIAVNFPTLPGLKTGFIGFEEDIPYFATSIPGVKTYVTAMKKYAPATLTNSNYSEGVIQNWISGLLMAKAIESAGATSGKAVTPATVYKGLYALHDETLGGMTPSLTFKKGQPTQVHCWFWIKAVNGKFTTPYGLTPACGTPVS
jgi:branched-chain amino acid transport system substrate-binding protein